MGLLDALTSSSIDDPKSQAVMGLAMGLLSGRGSDGFAKGIQGAMQGYQNAKQSKWQDELMQFKRAEMASQTDALKRKNDFGSLMQGLLNGNAPQINGKPVDMEALSVGPEMPDTPRYEVPKAAPKAQLGELLQKPEFLLAAKNAGFDLTEIAKFAKPEWAMTDGFAYNKNDPGMKPGFMPGITTTPSGQAVLRAVGPDGVPVVGAAPGSIDTYRAFQDVGEQAKAKLDPVKIYDPETQQEVYRPRSQVAGGQQPSGGQNFFSQLSGLAPEQRSAILADIAKNGNDNPTLGTFSSRAQPAQQPFAAGPSASQVATAKANEVGAEGLAKSSVKILEESYGSAKGAAASLQTINNIDSILSDKKLMLGTGSDARLALARLGQTIGVGGKDDAEKLANTTALMQQLAQAQLGAAKQMAGQGTITDAERRLLNDTAGGKTSFTAGELKVLSGALRKTAEHTLQSHGTLVSKMRGNPLYAPQMDAFTVDAPTQQKSSSGVKFLGFE